MDEAARQSAASLNLRRPVCLGKSVDFQKLFVFELNFGRMCFFCNQLSCAMNFISCDNNFKQRLGNPSVIAQKAPLCTFEAKGRASHNWVAKIICKALNRASTSSELIWSWKILSKMIVAMGSWNKIWAWKITVHFKARAKEAR